MVFLCSLQNMNGLRILQFGRRNIRYVIVRLSSSGISEALPDTFYQRSVPTKKLWWAKGITADLHVAGRLTDRQIKYASDNGFKSVVSLYELSTEGTFGGESLPTTDEAKIVAKIAGLHYDAVLRENEDWCTLAAIRKLSSCISQLEGPILLYSSEPESVAFATLMHLALMSKSNSNFTPQVNSDKFFKMSALMGMDFTDQKFKEIVASVTGEDPVEDPPKPTTHKNWLRYWLCHPLHGHWFTAGQIRRGHLQEIEAAGFKSVINMRMGTTLNDKPSQETITLVNIKDNQDTYDVNYNPVRQSTQVLESLVINPAMDRKYISSTSTVNYESRNPEEYGDDVGYNEDDERLHFKESSLEYYHMPIDLLVTYDGDSFRQYKDQLLEIGRQGPVLFHCAIGKRAAFIGTLAAALQYGKDLPWALKRIHELGFVVNEESFSDVLKMYKDILG